MVETAHTARNMLVNMEVQVFAVLCLHYSLCVDSEPIHAKDGPGGNVLSRKVWMHSRDMYSVTVRKIGLFVNTALSL